MGESSKYNPLQCWAIIEQLGHKRIAGYVTEVTLAGKGFLHVNIPDAKGKTVSTQFISPESLYCLTPVSEEIAMAVAAHNAPQPVQRWELPRITTSVEITHDLCDCGHALKDHDESGADLDAATAAGTECRFVSCSCAEFTREGEPIASRAKGLGLDLCGCGHAEGAHEEGGGCLSDSCPCPHFSEQPATDRFPSLCECKHSFGAHDEKGRCLVDSCACTNYRERLDEPLHEPLQRDDLPF